MFLIEIAGVKVSMYSFASLDKKQCHYFLFYFFGYDYNSSVWHM